jgi:hypothetical protein
MAAHLHNLLEYDQAEDLANAVQDKLAETARDYPGTTLEALARDAYDVVMQALGHGEDE